MQKVKTWRLAAGKPSSRSLPQHTGALQVYNSLHKTWNRSFRNPRMLVLPNSQTWKDTVFLRKAGGSGFSGCPQYWCVLKGLSTLWGSAEDICQMTPQLGVIVISIFVLNLPHLGDLRSSRVILSIWLTWEEETKPSCTPDQGPESIQEEAEQPSGL